jgi:hypothetical protein
VAGYQTEERFEWDYGDVLGILRLRQSSIIFIGLDATPILLFG